MFPIRVQWASAWGFLLLPCACIAAAADDLNTITLAPEPLPTQHEFDPLVVTGTRTEQNLSESPVPLLVIGRMQIERSGARDLAELLQREGGVQVGQLAGRGSTIEIQGLASEHVLILVDGRKVNGRVNGGIDLARLRVASIERIEIVRGPSSALYGADALGGVVNVITRRDVGQGQWRLRGDEHANADASVRGGQELGPWAVQGSAGYSRQTAYDLDPSRPGQDGQDSDAVYASATAERDISAGIWRTMALDWSWSLDDSERVEAGSGNALYNTRKRIEDLRIGLAPTLAVGASELSLQAHYARYHDQFLQQGLSGAQGLSDEETLDEQFAAGVQWDRQVAAHQLTGGFEYLFERLQADRINQRGERDRQSLYLQDQLRLWSHALTVVPGLRYDRDSEFGDQLSPKLALRWDIRANWMLRLGYGHGYRAPDFKQLLLRFDNPAVGYRVEGNPELEPESSRGLNLSTTWYASDRASFQLGAFLNNVDNLIELIQTVDGQPDPDDPVVFSYRNVSSARLSGADIQAQWQPSWRVAGSEPLQFKLGYAYLHSRDKASGRSLSGRARHRINAAVYFDRGSYALGLRGVWVDERRFAVETSTGGAPTEAGVASGYTLVDVRWEWRDLPRRLIGAQMTVGLKNIFDVGDARYLPITPRAAYIELSRTF